VTNPAQRSGASLALRIVSDPERRPEVAAAPRSQPRAEPPRIAPEEETHSVHLTIAMAAYNEAATIRAAVREVLSVSYPCPVELIVVDDGSIDGTAAALAQIDDDRVRVIRHPHNRGKGAAIRTAIAEGRGTYLLPFDADMEYRAEDIANVLAPVLNGTATVVYGSRLFGWNTVYQSFRYKMGNLLTTLAANVLFDSALSDLHTCIKLVPMPLLRSMALTESRFGLDTEITAKVLRGGHRPFEVPVHYYSRTHGEGKKINWRDGVRCLFVLVRVRIGPVPRFPVIPRQVPQAVESPKPSESVRERIIDLRRVEQPAVALDAQQGGL
jgi:dolichol-phosphate hexosyltransferase